MRSLSGEPLWTWRRGSLQCVYIHYRLSIRASASGNYSANGTLESSLPEHYIVQQQVAQHRYCSTALA
eukprot:9469-Heterococcus_DN1.PRE.2